MDPTSVNRSFSSDSHKFDLVFCNLMGKCKPVSGREKEDIVISGYIIGDGMGDWAHLQKEASVLSKKFPERKIKVIAISAEQHRGKIHPKDLHNVSYHIEYYGDRINGSPLILKSPFDNLGDILQTIKDASVWLSGPVAIKTIFDDLGEEKKSKGFAIHEYGTQLEHTDDFHKTVRLGLGEPEFGIYTHTAKEDYQWEKIESGILKKELFGATEITSVEVDEYLSHNAPFMCYVSKDDVALSFIYRAIFFGYNQCNKLNIDVVYPAKTDLSELKKGLIDIKYTFPIKLILVNGKKVIENKDIKEGEGVNLRIINPGRLSKKDFKKVMYLSSPLVGCTGNASIGQALSYGKIPYYEQLGQTFWTKKNLCEIARKVCGENSPLVYLLDPKPSVPRDKCVDREEKEKLSSSQLIEDAKKLGAVITDQYSLNECLSGIVNSHLFREKYPEAAAVIDRIKDRFLSKEIDIETAKVEIMTVLQKEGLLD